MPRPLLVRPDVSAILPSFTFPDPGSSILYTHQDLTALEGYADYVRSNPFELDGRERQWEPSSCPE